MVLHSLLSPSRYVRTRYDDPFTAMQRALDNVFTATPTEAAAIPVRLDVKEDEKTLNVTAELPGLTEKEVEVTFDDGLLTIRGEKKVERDEKKDTWHVIERSHGSFARQLSLAANIDADKIEAKFEKGVLNIMLPKVPEAQTAAKKINIKAG